MQNESRAYIAMNLVPGIGAVLARNIGEALGSVGSIFGASSLDLMQVPGIGAERAEVFARGFESVDVDVELARASDMGVKLVTLADAEYPKMLREIHDPPLVLYVQGDVEALNTASVAMVGTRGPTQYGLECAHRFGYQLAQAGVTVVSGLAYGVDTASHKAALQAKGRTVAVIGSGLDQMYPAENQGLADTIAASRGAVISEYPFGKRANKQTFPMRNRIVSGLSRAVLIVEADLKSGTMITANQALEQGRDVLAIPGRIDNPKAQGCLMMIKQGARLVTCVDDVLDELQKLPFARGAQSEGFGFGKAVGNSIFKGAGVKASGGAAPTGAPAPAPVLDAVEKAILEALEAAGGEAEVEVLLAKTGLAAYKVNAKLISLEMKRKVQQLPGRRVALKRS